ncbi:spore germination protein [Lachnoclostridium phytofermentans]|uniref:GerA spore germination protein n=1 Tax=Lachnoclostridium phytofermentans (strain ATCC 700394 / DSM 18823 / ISDg) TaxID=357809 RepID=A9KJY3_LACP7|nr:spore germination protein [Lachnoclostridium phytofermentans]ABX41138.1 GerA spore germination protein [Lachnoclostridium phytofermentans ISDg]
MSYQLGKDIHANMNYFNQLFKVDKSFDILCRTFQTGGRLACLYFINGFVDDTSLQRMLLKLETEIEEFPKNAKEYAEINISYIEIDILKEEKAILKYLFSGISLIFIDGFDEVIAIDARTYPARGVEEPEKDKVLRGSRDGFVETIVYNTALIRRRIRSNDLVMKLMEVGESSKTDVVVTYMDGRIDEKLLNRIISKLENLKIDSLSMNQESLAESLYRGSWFNPFPKYKYSERPDTTAACILEGSIVILVDNSPASMIIPSSLFDIIEGTDDYYFPPITGTYLRLSRMLISLIALILTPTFLLFMDNPQWIPKGFEFIIVRDPMNLPLIWQFMILELAIDGLKLAAVNTPSMLSTPLSVVAAVIIGDFTVSSGWFNSEAMLYMAFVVLANYTQVSFELGYALKFLRMIMLILTAIFGIWGYGVGIILVIVCVSFNKTVSGRSYLYPLIPFNAKNLLRRFFRVTLPNSKNQRV